MVYSGPTFYDDRTVFNTYMARRQQETSANESIEKPLIWQLLGDVNGLDILDLGCGEATIAHELLATPSATLWSSLRWNPTVMIWFCRDWLSTISKI
jgi:hypothetical protein